MIIPVCVRYIGALGECGPQRCCCYVYDSFIFARRDSAYL